MARGHIFNRSKSDRYTIVLSLGKDPATGKRRRQWLSVVGKKNAERKLAELLHQRDTGTYIKPRKDTLAEYLVRWLDDYGANLTPRAKERYAGTFNHAYRIA